MTALSDFEVSLSATGYNSLPPLLQDLCNKDLGIFKAPNWVATLYIFYSSEKLHTHFKCAAKLAATQTLLRAAGNQYLSVLTDLMDSRYQL